MTIVVNVYNALPLSIMTHFKNEEALMESQNYHDLATLPQQLEHIYADLVPVVEHATEIK